MEIVCFRESHHLIKGISNNYWHYIPELNIAIKSSSLNLDGEKIYEKIRIVRRDKEELREVNIAMSCFPKPYIEYYSPLKFIEVNENKIFDLIYDIQMHEEVEPRIKNHMNSFYKMAFC